MSRLHVLGFFVAGFAAAGCIGESPAFEGGVDDAADVASEAGGSDAAAGDTHTGDSTAPQDSGDEEAVSSACQPGCESTGNPCEVSVCDEARGICVTRAAPGTTPCDDDDFCTRSDMCGTGADAGRCIGSDPVVCLARGDCGEVGVCNPLSGVCTEPSREDGFLCEDAPGGDGHADEAGTCVAGECRRLPRIALGAYHGCALFWDGEIKCWGRNTSGELGLGHLDPVGGTNAIAVAETEPIRLSGASHIALGLNTTCAVALDGVRCWGSNGHLSLGADDDRWMLGGSPDTTPDLLRPVPLPEGFTARAVAPSIFSTCAAEGSGDVVCWGRGVLGYPGIDAVGGLGGRPIADIGPLALSDGGDPFAVTGLTNTSAVTCALSEQGRVRCWGGPQHLGFASAEVIGDDEAPADAPILNPDWRAVALSSADLHTCAVSEAGDVYCWGDNAQGQVGVGNQAAFPSVFGPVILGFDRKARGVAAGRSHTCVLTTDDEVLCWGDNNRGQLGRGHGVSVYVPFQSVAVELGGDAVQVAAGWYHTCAVLRDASVRCWGAGAEHQLGNGRSDDVGLLPGDLPPAAIAFD